MFGEHSHSLRELTWSVSKGHLRILSTKKFAWTLFSVGYSTILGHQELYIAGRQLRTAPRYRYPWFHRGPRGEEDEVACTIARSKSYRELRGLYEDTFPRTDKVSEKKDECFVQVQELWNNWPQSCFQKLIGSMSSSTRQVLDKNGGAHKYI